MVVIKPVPVLEITSVYCCEADSPPEVTDTVIGKFPDWEGVPVRNAWVLLLLKNTPDGSWLVSCQLYVPAPEPPDALNVAE